MEVRELIDRLESLQTEARSTNQPSKDQMPGVLEAQEDSFEGLELVEGKLKKNQLKQAAINALNVGKSARGAVADGNLVVAFHDLGMLIVSLSSYLSAAARNPAIEMKGKTLLDQIRKSLEALKEPSRLDSLGIGEDMEESVGPVPRDAKDISGLVIPDKSKLFDVIDGNEEAEALLDAILLEVENRFKKVTDRGFFSALSHLKLASTLRKTPKTGEIGYEMLQSAGKALKVRP